MTKRTIPQATPRAADNVISLDDKRQELASRALENQHRFEAMPEGGVFVVEMAQGFQPWNIHTSDVAILVKTPDVTDGDFAFVKAPGGYYLARVFFEGSNLRLSWPAPVGDEVIPLRDVEFAARVFGVYVCEAKRITTERALPFELRGFSGDDVQDYGEAA